MKKSRLHQSEIYQSHRMAWVEKDHNAHPVSTPSRPGCLEPHPAWPWMPPQVGQKKEKNQLKSYGQWQAFSSTLSQVFISWPTHSCVPMSPWQGRGGSGHCDNGEDLNPSSNQIQCIYRPRNHSTYFPHWSWLGSCHQDSHSSKSPCLQRRCP